MKQHWFVSYTYRLSAPGMFGKTNIDWGFGSIIISEHPLEWEKKNRERIDISTFNQHRLLFFREITEEEKKLFTGE